MAKHSSSSDNSWIMWLLAAGAAYWAYSQGYFTSLLSSVSSLIPGSSATTVPVTGAAILSSGTVVPTVTNTVAASSTGQAEFNQYLSNGQIPPGIGNYAGWVAAGAPLNITAENCLANTGSCNAAGGTIGPAVYQNDINVSSL